ncbi:MAG: ATP-binding protein [Desulfobulbaceae bacterium]
MKQKDLNNLLALGEGFTTEFKRSGTSNLGREICAFANATGGVILIGVSDAGEVVGVDDHNRLKSEVQAIARSAEPPIAVEVKSSGKVLCITVPGQHSKPYSFGGKFFIREGATSQQMSRSEIREFFYKEGLIHFDETPCEKFSLSEDLTDEVWALFRRRAKIPADMDPVTALTNLHLIGKDGRMTQAGAWLLARDIQKFNISADVACALFMGTDKVRILDRRGFNRDVYSLIDEVVAYILSKINVEYIIKHVKREERPELPEEALREAVVNALVHRDYRSTANVQVYIFKDRIEIVSPGGLPAGMTEADLGIKSIPRNPLLFSMLHRMEAVEHIGSGIKRIRGLCREYGVAEPRIEVSEHWFTMIFPRPGLPEEGKRAQPRQGQDDVEAQEAQAEAQERGQEAHDFQGKLQKWEISLLRVCIDQDATGAELLTAAGYSSRTGNFKRGLEKLLNYRLLEMTIPGKPRSSKQRYRLTALGRQFLEQQSKGRS